MAKYDITIMSDLVREVQEDGYYTAEVYYAVATDELGARFAHFYASKKLSDVEALAEKMTAKGVNPVDNEHWHPTPPVYGSPAYVQSGGDYANLMTHSERLAADGDHRGAELEAQHEDNSLDVYA